MTNLLNKCIKSILICLLILGAIPLNSFALEGKTIRVDGKDGTMDIRVYPINISIDGVVQDFEMEPFGYNNRTMVPVRFFAEAFGAKVDWNPDLRAVTIKYLDDDIMFVLGYNFAFKNSRAYVMDTFPLIYWETYKDLGRVYIPLRAAIDLMGLTIDYDVATNTAMISKSKDEKKDQEPPEKPVEQEPDGQDGATIDYDDDAIRSITSITFDDKEGVIIEGTVGFSTRLWF